MAIALGTFHREKTLQVLEDETGVDLSWISKARSVIHFAPELVDPVVAGGSLRQAYAVALQRKALQETRDREEAAALLKIRAFPELAGLVGSGEWTTAQAIAAIDA